MRPAFFCSGKTVPEPDRTGKRQPSDIEMQQYLKLSAEEANFFQA